MDVERARAREYDHPLQSLSSTQTLEAHALSAPFFYPRHRLSSSLQLAVAAAAALTGATVVSVDPRLPWDALFAVLDAEAPRALIMSPRGPPGSGAAGASEDRAAAIAERFAPELARFVGGAVWGYDPLESKRFRSLKYIVQTGFDDVPGVVQLADLASVGSGAWREIFRAA